MSSIYRQPTGHHDEQYKKVSVDLFYSPIGCELTDKTELLPILVELYFLFERGKYGWH